METIRVNMTPCEDIKTIHASQNDNEAREWGFELHNNGEKIDSSSISDQMVFKAYEGGTEQILPENGAVPVTAPFVGDIKYPDATRTDQEFLYRQSPTEEDGNAKIESLYGKTLVWNQLAEVALPSTSASGITMTNNYDGSFTLNGTATAQVDLRFDQPSSSMTNLKNYPSAKYLFVCDNISSSVQFIIMSYPDYVRMATFTSSPILALNPITGRDNCFMLLRVANGTTLNNVRIRPQFFNLTAIFGQGNEPTTYEEFRAIFPLPYYDHCQGVMLSFGGRNVKFNQLVQNGNFASTSGWQTYNGRTLTIVNNTATILTNEYSQGVVFRNDFKNVQEHVLYICADLTSDTELNYARFNFYLNGADYQVAPTYQNAKPTNVRISAIWKSTMPTADRSNMYFTISTKATNATLQIKNFQIFDLTEMFGVGNEPSIQGFRELFPNDYYEYTTEQYMNLGQPVSLKTVGFNQWDEEWEVGAFNNNTGEKIANANRIRSKNIIRVTPNETYYFKAPNNGQAYYFDGNMNYVGFAYDLLANRTFVVPSNMIYMYFAMATAYGNTYNNDICINLSSDENGEYEPYTSSTLSLPISTYFPTGMKSAGNVYDELTETKAITRIGSRAYQSGDEDDTSVITDGTTTYYALATPIETEFTTASLVTENEEIPLSNEDGVLIGKCTEQLSSESGFFDAKIKLADEDGECYSNKIQLHVERSPQ